MTEVNEASTKLAGMLRHVDDLDKLHALKAEFTRKKTNVDSQLRAGLQEQLQITQSGMTSISDGQRTISMIKDEMMKIDKLCAEAQNMIKDFPFVDKIAQTHHNFAQVEEMKSSIDNFGPQLEDLDLMLDEDDQDLENQNNLLAIHFGLSKLRDVRDQAMDQVSDAQDVGLELINNLQLHGGVTLQDHFTKLDEVVDRFDHHIGVACMNLIPLVQDGNTGLVVRMALIIEEEEKRDRHVKALQDAQKEFSELTSRLKSMNAGQKQPREYKNKFLLSIEAYAKQQFDSIDQAFEQEPDKLEKSVRWFFNDLQTVKVGMLSLFPKKWDIFNAYINIYHRLMHDFLIVKADDKDLGPPHLKALLHWVEKYHAKMTKLSVKLEDLQPHVIDDRGAELVQEYRSIIVRKVEEWMDNIAAADEKSFLEHTDEFIDEDQHGYLRTKRLADMWRMLKDNVSMAGFSERNDVGEGVVDAMMRALQKRQAQWAKLIDQEIAPFKAATLTADQESAHEHLLRWTIALANDQIACIDENDDVGHNPYLTDFFNLYRTIVSPGWAKLSEYELDQLRGRYVDLSTRCISAFVTLVYSECRDPSTGNTVFGDFFNSRWQTNTPMPRIAATVEDYLELVVESVHPSLRDILVEEFAEELLVRYLSAVTKNSGVKFKQQNPDFVDLIRQDVKCVFGQFEKYPDSFQVVRETWKAASFFLGLISAIKGQEVVVAYESFKTSYPDLQMSWVEGVLKTRDDYDRSMLASVKARAAEMRVLHKPTVMAKIH